MVAPRDAFGDSAPQPATPAVAPAVAARGRQALYALILLTLVNAFSTTDRYVFSMLLPLIKRDLALSDAVLGLLSGAAFAISYSLLSLPFAYLADRSSRKTLIAIGFAAWSTVTALTGAVASAVQLALARFLLGAAEATSLAPSTSMLADLFDRRRRVFALAVIGASQSIGMLAAFPIIGFTAERLGWRAAFFAVGIPGVLMALLFQLTVREPPRGAADGESRSYRAGLSVTVGFLLRSRAYLLLVAGGALTAINLGVMQAWTPTFLMRVHHLTEAQIGGLVGIARGPGGIAGSLLGGFLATRLSARDPRWQARVPALAMGLLCPVDLLLLLSPDPLVWKAALVLDGLLSMAIIGPCFAVCANVARPEMRSVSSALYLILASLTGLSLGPYVVGYANDHLAPVLGAAAIRYSMAFATATALLGGLAYLAAAAFIPQDSARALDRRVRSAPD